MLATLGDTFRDVGTVCAAIAAFLGLVALIARLPPVRWVVRHLVTDPLAQWFKGQIREELERTNGGSSLMDRVKKCEAAIVANETKQAPKSPLYGLGEGK